MRAVRKAIVGSLSTGILAAVCVTSISSSSYAATSSAVLDYKLSGLPANSTLTITYSTGIAGNTGGSAQAHSGSMSFVHFFSNHILEVASSHNTVLTADINETVLVNGPEITGDADIPSGASLKVLPPGSDELIDVPNGHFSIPTGQLTGKSSHKEA
jgi:hypothetical protein